MAETLLDRAQAKYGFLKNLGMQVVENPREGDMYAETWPAGEPGSADYPRPQSIPLEINGVEVLRPDQFSEDDLAGEGFHIDPEARRVSDYLATTFTPEQLDALKGNAADYEQSIQMGMDEDQALQNSVDSLVRGYVMGQWPPEAIESMGLDEDQRGALESLRAYALTGQSGAQQEQQGFSSVFSE